MLDYAGDTSRHLRRGPVSAVPSAAGKSDDAAVTEVVNRYAYALDDRDWAGLDEVFAEDAVARYGRPAGRPITGRTAIVQMIRSMLDGCGPSQHLLATHIVTVDGDTAVSMCKARVYHYGAGVKAALEPYECFGVYRHSLRRTAAGWRVAELHFDVHHTVGDIRIVQPDRDRSIGVSTQRDPR
ncbi:nuclear transport factor 2 family protein [Nocardia sp. NPDC052254]|uniref:nuclear transport factor 2 family protein n=1 Tax=Nocardia sp. NPDC052254 TaxID=3155681 RepID=UPI0034127FFB